MADRITRRNFLKLGLLAAGASVIAGCENPRRWITLEPYVRPPEEQLAGEATWYASTCRQCPAGCGIVVRIMNGRAVKIEGNPEHPLNRGKTCARGQAGLQVLYNPDRLQGPVVQSQRGTRQFQSIAWNDGINTLFTKIQAAGNQVAVWGGSTMSAHLYDLFARFNGAIGAPAPLLFDLYTAFHGYRALGAASQSLFGRDVLPAYDVENADVVFSFGGDFLDTWLSAVRYDAQFGQFRSQPLGKRGYLVQFEPRMSITAAKADHWVPVKPGTEALVAQALLRLIADQSLGSAERVQRAKAWAGKVDLNAAAAASEVSVTELERLARIFSQAAHPLAIPGSPLTGQDNSAEAVGAVQALNIIGGTLGAEGGMSLSPSAPSEATPKPPMSSFADVEKLIEQMRAGAIQVLLVHGANPIYDLPERAGFADALGHVPFVVSFAPIVDETALWSDLILPDRTYLEAWGYEVISPAFDQPVVSGQQPVVMPVYDSRSTADILLTIARGIPAAAKALPWADEVAFLKETVSRLGAGAAGGSGTEVLWSRFLQHGGWWQASPAAGPVPSPTAPKPVQLTSIPPQGDEKEYPFYLYLFMDELLSDGRGANQPWLQGVPASMSTIAWQTWVEINPATAQRIGVQDGDVVSVTSPFGEIEAIIYTYPAIRPDTVAIPLGQGHTDYGRYARGRGANPMRLIGLQSDTSGSGLAWSSVRVKLAPTGKRVAVANLESKVGVTQGFINQGFPGQ
jgi:anaerobic selenocysteine-containing dehydrogenase